MSKKLLILLSFLLIVQLICIFPSMNISAATAAPSGFVTASGTSFMLDGKPFRFAGCNNYDLFTYGDGSNDATPDDIETKFMNKARIDEMMSNMAADGVKVVRTWGFSHETWHGFEQQKGVYNEAQFMLFDYILESAKKHNIKVIIVLENYWEAYGGIDTRLKWEGLPGVSHPNRAVFFTNAGCKEQYKNYVEHFVTRINHYTNEPYKNDPAIFSWELMNEPRYQDVSAEENVKGTTLRAWVDEMGKFIKDLDPNHMVSTGLEGQSSKYGYGADAGNPFVYIHQSPYIDFTTAHPYPDEAWAGLDPDKAAALVAAWINDSHNIVKKPFVMEEFNTHNNKEQYWNAMYGQIEKLNASGDLFWDYASYSGGFYIMHGDPLLQSVFKPHADKMAAEVPTDPVMPGDLNRDGSIDALDFAQMKMYILTQNGSVDMKVWDLNYDTQVDSLDLVALKKILLG
jgi:hypothetical protein